MNQSFSQQGMFIRMRSWMLLFFGFDAAFWVFLFLHPLPYIELVAVDDVLQCIGPLLAAVLCFTLFRRRSSTSMLLLTTAIFIHTIGDILWYYEEAIIRKPPFPSIADIAFLISYPLLLRGILLLPTYSLSFVARVSVTLDGLIMTMTFLIVSWYFVLGPVLLLPSESLLARAVGTAYPCLDQILLLCTLLLWARSSNPKAHTGLLMLSSGLIVITLGDGIFNFLSMHNVFATGSPIDILGSLGYHCIALGAFALWRTSYSSLSLSHRISNIYHYVSYIIMPCLIILFYTLFAVYVWYIPSDRMLQLGVYGGVILLFGLLLVRFIIARRERHTLARKNNVLA